MNKKVAVLVVVAIIVVVIVAGYFIFIKDDSKDLSSDVSQTQENSSFAGETVSTNPMDNKPDLNPVDKSNPFRSIKTNPFE